MAKTTVERLAELEKQAEAIKARMQALKAREKLADRKRDTRRKVILGGLLLAKAAEDEVYARVVERLLKAVERPADRSAFDGWEPPKTVATTAEERVCPGRPGGSTGKRPAA